MDLMPKVQQAICKYMAVPAAEAQSRYVQMVASEHALIAAAFDDAASGLSTPEAAKDLIGKVWLSSCERRKAEAENVMVVGSIPNNLTAEEQAEFDKIAEKNMAALADLEAGGPAEITAAVVTIPATEKPAE